jgi:hypothetical protein
MKAKLAAGALYAALLAIAALVYADEPKGFRDVPWGTSEETLRFRIPTQSCVDVVSTVEFGTRRCRARNDVTFGKLTPAAVFFYFRNDMLVAWRVTSYPRFREMLAKTLMQQYGEPTVVYKGDHVVWKGRTTDVDFVGGPGYDVVDAVTKAELATREAERQDRARRSASAPRSGSEIPASAAR